MKNSDSISNARGALRFVIIASGSVFAALFVQGCFWIPKQYPLCFGSPRYSLKLRERLSGRCIEPRFQKNEFTFIAQEKGRPEFRVAPYECAGSTTLREEDPLPEQVQSSGPLVPWTVAPESSVLDSDKYVLVVGSDFFSQLDVGGCWHSGGSVDETVIRGRLYVDTGYPSVSDAIAASVEGKKGAIVLWMRHGPSATPADSPDCWNALNDVGGVCEDEYDVEIAALDE